MKGGVFLSYRRELSSAATGRLFDRLGEKFEKRLLFMDVDSILPGYDFPTEIRSKLESATVLLAIIGPGWAAMTDGNGQRRLDDHQDYVRIEIETALKRNIKIVPVLVDGGLMPRQSELPIAIRDLCNIQAIELPHHRFSTACDDLASLIAGALPPKTASKKRTTSGQSTNPKSPAEVAFSYRGRIPRSTYWKYLVIYSVVGLIISFLIQTFIIAIELDSGKDLNRAIEHLARYTTANPDWRVKAMSTVSGGFMLWPLSALIVKRLHDFN